MSKSTGEVYEWEIPSSQGIVPGVWLWFFPEPPCSPVHNRAFLFFVLFIIRIYFLYFFVYFALIRCTFSTRFVSYARSLTFPLVFSRFELRRRSPVH